MDRFRVAANLATLANGLVGVGAILYVLAGNKLWAMLLVVCGIGFDGLDGLFSRKSSRPSRGFGRVADSVADAVTFGLAPAAILLTHTDRAALWAPFASGTALVGAAVAALAIARLVYFTLRGYEWPYFVGAPTPQTALAIVLVVAFLDVPAFAGTNPPVLLLLAGVLGILMIVPIRFPKIRRGGALRPIATATAIALVGALLPLQFRPVTGSPLYELALLSSAVGVVGTFVYYVWGPVVVRREATHPV